VSRLLIAVLAVVVLDIGVAFLIGLYGGRGVHNLLYLSIPAFAVAVAAFSGWRSKLLGAAGLLPLFWPASVGAEMIAHAAGTCLQ
jgi:hypothetical protein